MISSVGRLFFFILVLGYSQNLTFAMAQFLAVNSDHIGCCPDACRRAQAEHHEDGQRAKRHDSIISPQTCRSPKQG